jgi:hypothetical protein
MMKWFLNWLEKKGRKSVILDRDGKLPYLNRWYVAYPDGDQRQRKDIRFNIFIHQFMQSDYPVLHTHPWWFIAVILKGGYWEHLPGDKKVWRGPGSIRFDRNCTHWVEIEEPGKTWTLFIRGRTTRDWGFIHQNKWMYWDTYLKMMRLK